MKNTTWERIIPGQIVNFIYKSQDQKAGTRRWTICIDPKYRYRKKNGRTSYYFVGIQIDEVGRPRQTKPVIKEIIRLLGGVAGIHDAAGRHIGRQVDIEGVVQDERPRDVSSGEFSKVYRKLKQIIKRESIFRTYNLRECKKRRVFLEDKYDFIPRENIKDFVREIDIGQEVVVEN
jgi:hypothetical protein